MGEEREECKQQLTGAFTDKVVCGVFLIKVFRHFKLLIRRGVFIEQSGAWVTVRKEARRFY